MQAYECKVFPEDGLVKSIVGKHYYFDNQCNKNTQASKIFSELLSIAKAYENTYVNDFIDIPFYKGNGEWESAAGNYEKIILEFSGHDSKCLNFIAIRKYNEDEQMLVKKDTEKLEKEYKDERFKQYLELKTEFEPAQIE